MKILLMIALASGLVSCTSVPPGVAGPAMDQDCRRQANDQTTGRVVDRLWRDHERYRLYRACVRARDQG